MNTPLIAKCFAERLAETDADVFDCVVLIDVQIPRRGDVETKRGVPRE
jgi:hypothetical protein